MSVEKNSTVCAKIDTNDIMKLVHDVKQDGLRYKCTLMITGTGCMSRQYAVHT